MHHSFLPPYLLERLAPREDTSGAPAATLRLDAQLRDRRQQPTRSLEAPAAADEGRRLIHTANNTETLPGDVVRREGDPPSGDAAVDEAFDSTGQVWDLFSQVFGRESFDGQGSTTSVTVHYGTDYDNAFWDGQQLVFGDGDGEIFDRFTKPMDVLAHEFTHGVVQYTAALTYSGQSGALNESVADVFASMTKQRSRGQTVDQADWLIGEGLFVQGVNAKALRSMIEPGTAYDDERLGKDPQVGSMADYVDTQEDNGGVHINSGIPNRAFALAADALGGSSWERAGRVWYDALSSGEVGADADFATFAQATVSSAGRVFADQPDVAQQVQQAWSTVGVLTPSSAVVDGESGGTDDPAGPSGSEAPAGGTGEPTEPSGSGEPAEPSGSGEPAEPSGSGEPAEPGGSAWPHDEPGTVEVRRTGGFTGGVRAAELDLAAEPEGPEVRTLLQRVDFQQVTVTEPTPDRFVYTVVYGSIEVTLGEQDLTPELSRVVQIVLHSGRHYG